MNKIAILFLLFTFLFTGLGYGEDLGAFQIKLGMHESAVNDRYGMPVVSERIKEGFWPISKKKALYRIDGSDYMILHFFSGRVKNVTILEDTVEKEALQHFNEK